MRLILMRNTYLAGLAVVIMGIVMLFQAFFAVMRDCENTIIAMLRCIVSYWLWKVIWHSRKIKEENQDL